MTDSLTERVMACGGRADLKIPSEFERFFELVIPALIWEPELAVVLEYSDHLDRQAMKLGQAFALYPEDYAKFLEMVRVIHGAEKKEMTDETMIRLHGIENSRNFLLALHLAKLSKEKGFEWESNARPKADPKSALRFALRAELAFPGRHQNLAFAAGLAFDILIALAPKLTSAPAPVQEFAKNMFQLGMDTARIGVAVSRRARSLMLAEFMVSVCLLRYVGRAVAVLLRPEEILFYTALNKDGLPPSVERIVERRRIAPGGDCYANLVARYFNIFNPIQEALLFQRQPYLLLHRGETDQWNLATVCALAANMQRHRLSPAAGDDPAIRTNWLRAEVREIELTGDDLFEIARALKAEG